MVRYEVASLFEPPVAYGRQQLTFARYQRQVPVESRIAVGGYYYQLFAEIVYVAYLTPVYSSLTRKFEISLLNHDFFPLTLLYCLRLGSKLQVLGYHYSMEEGATIGIVGGGQLGRMLTLAALPLGFKVVVVDPKPGSPASQVGAKEITADLYDGEALRRLAEEADYITVEIEHLDTEILGQLVESGARINPSPKTIRLIQDKYMQKEFLKQAGIPLAPFRRVDDEKEANEAFEHFGHKMLFKTRHGAYDGRGNMLITKKADIRSAMKRFEGRKLYAEGYVPFVKELAVMAAKGADGNLITYPVVETIHRNNICHEVIAPAEVSAKIAADAEKLAKKVVGLLEGAGTYGIEMFLTAEGKVLVNEIAPRVHNSGHYTIEANRTSQFEQHIRAITGLPLGDTAMVVPAAVMINILGERDGPTNLTGLKDVLKVPHTSIHIYGKSPTKFDRKMGHITSTGSNVGEARDRARKARDLLNI